MRRLSMSPQCMVAWRLGQKIWTRRVVSAPQPDVVDERPRHREGEWGFWHDEHWPNGKVVRCPYGEVGDVVAIAERHRLAVHPLEIGYVCTYAGWEKALAEESHVIPAADFVRPPGVKHPDRWRAAMFMPETCCREWARIRSIGVERLSALTDAAAIEEGVVVPSDVHLHAPRAPWLMNRDTTVTWYMSMTRFRVEPGGAITLAPNEVGPSGKSLWAARLPDGYTAWYPSPAAAFMVGWHAIQATRAGGSVGSDPWVWVLGLERVDRDGQPRGRAGVP